MIKLFRVVNFYFYNFFFVFFYVGLVSGFGVEFFNEGIIICVIWKLKVGWFDFIKFRGVGGGGL